MRRGRVMSRIFNFETSEFVHGYLKRPQAWMTRHLGCIVPSQTVRADIQRIMERYSWSVVARRFQVAVLGA